MFSKLVSKFTSKPNPLLTNMDNDGQWMEKETKAQKNTVLRIYKKCRHFAEKYKEGSNYELFSDNGEILGIRLADLNKTINDIRSLDIVDFYRSIWIKIPKECRTQLAHWLVHECLVDLSEAVFLRICLDYNYVINKTCPTHLDYELLGETGLVINGYYENLPPLTTTLYFRNKK